MQQVRQKLMAKDIHLEISLKRFSRYLEGTLYLGWEDLGSDFDTSLLAV